MIRIQTRSNKIKMQSTGKMISLLDFLRKMIDLLVTPINTLFHAWYFVYTHTVSDSEIFNRATFKK